MYRLFCLKNGLNVVISPITHSEVCTVGLWLAVGSRNEQIHQHGISHLIEHMFLKRTKTHSFLEIVSQIEGIGGSINAYTGYEVTAYHTSCLSKFCLKSLGIIADIFQNYTFILDEFTKEKDVVLQEINESLDNHVDNVFDYARQICYPSQALGRNILGTIQSIGQFSISDLQSYINCNYYSKPVLSIVGNIDPDEIYQQCVDLFSYDHQYSEKYLETPAKFNSGIAYFNKKNLTQTHIVMLFPGLTRQNHKFYSLMALSNIFGEGMSSRLFYSIREQHGLAYSLSSFVQPYLDTGLFGVYLSTTSDLIHKCVSIIKTEIQKIQENIHDSELNKAIAQLNMGLYLSHESSYTYAQRLAYNLIYHNKILAVSDITTQINKITVHDIQQVATDTFSTKPPVIAILGHDTAFDVEVISHYFDNIS